MKIFLLTLSVLIIGVVSFIVGHVEKEIIDDVNIILALGLDKHEDGGIKGTALIPVFKADQSIGNETFTGKAVIGREAITALQKKSADPLVTGGLKVALYGESLAKDGLIDYIDGLQRDASIGSNLFLGVVDGEAEDILNKNLGNRGTGMYLSRLIEHNIQRRDVPQSNLQEFIFRYYSEGMDPYLPYLKLLEDKVEIKGLAIFQEDRMVDFISEDDLFFFKALVENFGAGSYTVHIKNPDEYGSVERIKSERDIKVEEVDGKPKVIISVYFRGILSSYTGPTASPNIVKEIISQIEKEIVSHSEKMIKSFQEKGVDPIGIGFFARSSSRQFDKKKWSEEYPQINIEVKAKVDLDETGVIE